MKGQTLRVAAAGPLRRVVIDSTSVVVDMGRKQRLFTGTARQAAMLLTTHCEHPGCDLPADWCHTDHATEWAHGGTTDQTNSGIRCNQHNIAKTRHRWSTTRARNGHNDTLRPDGTIILPTGTRPPQFPDPPVHDGHPPTEIIRYTHHARQRAAALRRP